MKQLSLMDLLTFTANSYSFQRHLLDEARDMVCRTGIEQPDVIKRAYICMEEAYRDLSVGADKLRAVLSGLSDRSQRLGFGRLRNIVAEFKEAYEAFDVIPDSKIPALLKPDYRSLIGALESGVEGKYEPQDIEGRWFNVLKPHQHWVPSIVPGEVQGEKKLQYTSFMAGGKMHRYEFIDEDFVNQADAVTQTVPDAIEQDKQLVDMLLESIEDRVHRLRPVYTPMKTVARGCLYSGVLMDELVRLDLLSEDAVSSYYTDNRSAIDFTGIEFSDIFDHLNNNYGI